MSELMKNTAIKDTIITAIKVGAPMLIGVLVIGLAISILQATTQIQEQTLTFVPKLIATAVIGLLLGNWMLHTIIDFSMRIFDMIATISS